MSEISDLADTVTPKSDQLNADDLITGDIDVVVENVVRGPKDQPIHIIIGNGRQPYKPCKIMRRVLIQAWGKDGNAWIGRSMRLYCDTEVTFGPVKMGGIRISHVSHISKPIDIMLTVSRCRRSLHVISPLEAVDHSAVVAEYWAIDGDDARNEKWMLLGADEQKAVIDSQSGGK